MGRTSVCVVCGGQSAEHEVSLQSARNVLGAMDRERYEVVLAGIGKDGVWRLYGDEATFCEDADDPSRIRLSPAAGVEAFPVLTSEGAALVEVGGGRRHPFRLLFPVLHGTNGEDGAIQGLCRMLNVPCVGCDQAASANCMDKDIAKRLLEADGVRVARWVTLRRGQPAPSAAEMLSRLGSPVFVKPSRAGSSVGVSKVRTPAELSAAVEEAFRYDTKVLVEEAIVGREIECAVLGDSEVRVAVPGEVIPKVEFYSYEAKYIMSDGAALEAPARLTQEQVAAVQALAARAFRCLECSGMARVDFFLTHDGEWVLNELNTIPGFTRISMYPRLWQLSGLSYAELVGELMELALSRPALTF